MSMREGKRFMKHRFQSPFFVEFFISFAILQKMDRKKLEIVKFPKIIPL